LKSQKYDTIDSIAIGGFDGMHLAHQQLFDRLTKDGAIVSIETPYANLTPNRYRDRYSDYPIIYYKLDDIKEILAVDFIGMLKDKFPNLTKIVVGYDFYFGYNRTHCVDKLKDIFDGVVDVVDEFFIDGISVHSKVIREALDFGDIELANKLLGREYSIIGKVVSGQGIGKKELLPTINLQSDKFLLPKGVFSTKTKLDDKIYQSISFIGDRVSTDGKFAIETHIIDKNIDCSCDEVEIFFVSKIRDNKKFNSLEQLKQQIDKDIQFLKVLKC
jgi:riboflavin kinase/FMN adenylyltransferase